MFIYLFIYLIIYLFIFLLLSILFNICTQAKDFFFSKKFKICDHFLKIQVAVSNTTAPIQYQVCFYSY